MLNAVPSPTGWHELARFQTFSETVPAKLQNRYRVLCSLLSAFPGSRHAAKHFRTTRTPQVVECVFDAGTVTEHVHVLECSPEVHALLSRLPNAPLKPEVKRM